MPDVPTMPGLTPPAEPAVRLPDADPGEARRFVRRAAGFVALGAVLYLGLYAGAESLVRRHAHRNRFFMVNAASGAAADYVVLGASHATVFDFQDMNARLEQLTRSRILNLSVVGGGITVNKLLLEYFLSRASTRGVVYFLDSFVFHSRQWNEDRVRDVRLLDRAPFDLRLAALLFETPATRQVAFDYLLGFSKINNQDRFKPDVREEEGSRFLRAYRPVPQIDEQRIAYLYGDQRSTPAGLSERYLREFEALVDDVVTRGSRFVAIKPPIPDRVYRMLPDEPAFDAVVTTILRRHGAEFFDFSLVANDEKFFYDTDHLNRDGVLNFYTHHLVPVLEAGRATASRDANAVP